MNERLENRDTCISRPRSDGCAGNRRRRRSQIPLGIATGILFVAIGIYFLGREAMMGFFWFTGIAFGFVLQRARFCFAAAMRDPVLTGRTGTSKGVLVALVLTSIGFRAIMYGAHRSGSPVPGMNFVAPIGVHTAVGAFFSGVAVLSRSGWVFGVFLFFGAIIMQKNALEHYDVVIIGGGPARLTAGIYCGRARLKTLVIEQTQSFGVQFKMTDVKRIDPQGETKRVETFRTAYESPVVIIATVGRRRNRRGNLPVPVRKGSGRKRDPRGTKDGLQRDSS